MKKTLITLAALAMASVASAATYSYDSDDFTNNVLTLGTTLDFGSTTNWTMQIEITVGTWDYNEWGTPALVSGTSATANDTPLKLYFRNNDGVVNNAVNTNDTNLEKGLRTVLFGGDHTAGSFTGLKDEDALTVTWNYNAVTSTFSASYSLVREGTTYSDNGFSAEVSATNASKSFSQLSTVVLGQDGWSIDSVSVTTAAVPEPATATLSLLALAGLAARRRRK